MLIKASTIFAPRGDPGRNQNDITGPLRWGYLKGNFLKDGR